LFDRLDMAIEIKDEWTQEEFLRAKREFESKGRKVVLVDTILSPIEMQDVITYNPYEMQKYPKGSIFVFYCDSGKATKERLSEYKAKFPEYHCISLRGGKGYWRKYMRVSDEA